uniref:Myosin IXA n=1 Tax=Dicentrarchus labrax TaxID=13489 RepID=A0A8C4NSB4_DICLA
MKSLCHNLSNFRFENSEFTVRIYPGALAEGTIYCPISARKTTTAAEAIERVIERLQLDRTKCYVLAEVKEFGGEEWILNPSDCPVQRMMLWPRVALEHRPLSGGEDYRFLLRQKNLDGSIHYGGSLQMWLQVTEERRRMVERGLLPQPDSQGDHADLCYLPELNERSLLDNLRSRFRQEKIYTYVGSILIVINPFKFLPIYNPKYVKMYDNHTLGDLEPHIYAVADVAYHAMLQRERNQCIVISGESGSGKTQSTNFLIHHLTALSQKGFASGVEQIILGAGPVLEAFGNAKTAHNNNSSRFGKFIQVNYQESGTVRGAYVEKYLLEKSRLVYQEHNERNYHVFYYLLAGASEDERKAFHLMKPEEYHYLSQMTKKTHQLHWDSYYESEPDCFAVEGEDLKHDFERLQLAMEMVGFLPATRKQIFCLLSAILHLGNIRYKRKTYRDDSIDICNPEVLPVVSELLEVLTLKDSVLPTILYMQTVIAFHTSPFLIHQILFCMCPLQAGTVRDSMAKSLYSALFDWIVFRINHALLNVKDLVETTKILSIGVLDIFGFEDYENNSFEQFCINFANERLQHYFNQHIFKLEQEEYRAEGISWHNIDYIDNTGCINLISKKPTALFHLLDEECNFPQATNQTLLDKFKRQHEGNSYIEFPAVMEPAFIIRHYAGKVKYGVKDFREKNTDHMRPDIVALLKSSKNAFICGLMGIDPAATFRWAVLRAYFRALVAFREAGKRHTQKKTGHDDAAPCAVLKSVDSFSFLQHPVHQRSLEILQRCKEEKYSVTRKSPRTPLSDLQGSNTINEKSPRGSPGLGWNGRVGRQSRLSSGSSTTEEDGIFFNSASSKLLERAHDILMSHLLNVKSLKYLSNLTLHDRITKSLLHLHKKKKPPSISAQFQASLNKLMETLGQSEPYFVKCIRSNAEKLPLRFNDNLVLRQLRYTGMLETVRIRQSGYNIKYSFKDFVHHFSVLLPEGTSATREGIQQCLDQLDLEPDGYQVGKTMVFLREAERQRLQALLHREVLRRIVTLQRRFRARLERKQFVRMREAAICIQKWWRSYRSIEEEEEENYDPAVQEGAALCVQKHWRGFRERQKFRLWREAALVLQRAWRLWLYRRCTSALVIQTAWRCHQAREAYLHLYSAVVQLQAMGRGYLARQRLKEKEQQEKTKESPSKVQTEALASFPTSTVVVRERSRTVDEPSQKTTRAKRESRRMRELEQAKFSLELLKVRATSGGASSPSEERRWSVELVPPSTPPLRSPQGTPDSQSSKGSFEHLSMDDEPPKATEEVTDSEDLCSSPPPVAPVPEEVVSASPKPAPFKHAVITSGKLQVGRAGQKKKARMARTRSDFLTRAPVLSVGGDSDEDDYDGDSPVSPVSPVSPRHYTLPLSKQSSTETGLRESCFSDSDMVKGVIQANSGSLYALKARVRGKMRFWGKTKYGDKKTSREKLISHFLTAGQENMSPPCSPDLMLDHGFRDLKENKEPSPKVKRRRSVKISSVALEPAQWQNDALQILTCTNDYRSMNDFLMKKISDLDTEDSKKDTMVDVVFKKALKEFRLNIFNSYSTALAMDDGKSIRYKDLYALFEHILEKTMRQEQRDWRESPVTVWVNTFKVFLDEFMTEYKPLDTTISKVPKPERKKRRKKDTDIVEEHNGHIFKSTQYSIPTYCEYCSSLIWMMDRACVCKCECACKYVFIRAHYVCVFEQFDPELSSRQFGVEVSRLTNDERTVPLVVEKLINYIEMHGLYTEGIYRKSGSTNKIKELKQGLDTGNYVDSMNLDDYNIHVIASVFKQWLRDLPNPLMTFELYEEFIRAMCLQDKKEMIRGVYSVIDQLSRTHLNTLERLIFHLVRIALQEDTNRMSANALAIVFAPCILRCPDTIDPLQSVQDIGKTTACVEVIICEQMNKYKVRLKDISSLEFAENKAKCRLTLIRRSMGKGHVQRLSYHAPSPPVSPRLPSVADVVIEESGDEEGADSIAQISEHQQVAMQQEERVLTEQIESLQKEKEELTFEMLTLEPRASDDETLESEASIGTADSSENLNVDSEGTISDFSGMSLSDGKSPRRRVLRRQPESLDSVDSCSSVSSYSSSSHFHPSSSSSSPQSLYTTQASRSDSIDSSPTGDQEGAYDERPQFTSRGTFNPERGKQKLKGAKHPALRHSREGDGHGRDPPDIPQQLVLYGSNEFMV